MNTHTHKRARAGRAASVFVPKCIALRNDILQGAQDSDAKCKEVCTCARRWETFDTRRDPISGAEWGRNSMQNHADKRSTSGFLLNQLIQVDSKQAGRAEEMGNAALS